jgi:hypothetical protein
VCRIGPGDLFQEGRSVALKPDVVAILLMALIVLPVYVLRLDRVVGMVIDDAWYVLLAKALAEGRGYWLVNAPLDGILPGYPPGFPALLSLVFRLRPDFPDNLWLLKTVSIVAMLGVTLLSYYYLHRLRQQPRHIAALVSLGVATTPALVFLATSTTMSESVFTLAQLAVVVVGHRAVAALPIGGTRLAVFAGVLGGATVLIRSVGVGVVAAVALCLIKERKWKQLSAFVVTVAICVGPWLMYARAHAPTAQHREIHRGSLVYGYGDQFWMRFAGSASSGRVTIAELPGRVLTNVIDVGGRSFVGIFGPILLRDSGESGEEVLFLGRQVGWTFIGFGGLLATIIVSCVLGLIIVWGFVRTVRERWTVAEFLVPLSLVITLLWPFWTFRFVLPLTPFLYLYFVKGLMEPAAARIVLLVVISLNLYDHGGYIARVRSDPANGADWIANFQELDTTLEWMKAHLEPDAVVATTNPAIVHLWTGHKTITLDRVMEPWSVWRTRGARYVACLVSYELPGAWLGSHNLVYQSHPERPISYWVIDLH